MGDLKLTSASGSVTLSPENVAGTTTITLPSSTATLATNENFTSTGIDDNATSTAVTLDSSGNMGLGVVPESAWNSGVSALQVGGIGSIYGETAQSANGVFRLSNNCRLDATQNKYIVTDEASQYNIGDGGHTFLVASSGTADNVISWTTAMTIENDNSIKLNNPTTDGSGMGVKFFNAGGSNTSPEIFISASGATNRKMIKFFNPNGNVGDITCNGSSTAYNTSSDYRLKENVVPMTGSIDRVKALKPSRFNFITDPDTTVDGFLAHEAQEVVPEAISGDKDAMTTEEYEVTPAIKDENDNIVTEAVMGTREVPDMQGIDQAKLVPLLVGAIQEQQTLIESLQADIAILKGATI